MSGIISEHRASFQQQRDHEVSGELGDVGDRDTCLPRYGSGSPERSGL